MIARTGIDMRFQDKLNPPQAEKGNTMSENKKTPDLELENLEDEELKDVAGGFAIHQTFKPKMPIADEIPIPGIPSEKSQNDENKSSVKR